MPNYTKLFNSIITSTIWTEDDKTRIMWITMLAMADKNGEVQGSIPGLARMASMSVGDAESAITKLMAPDAYSRTPDNEGRRIAKIDGGWELLNHGKYRQMASKEDAKAATAERVRRLRARNANVTQCNAHVTVGRDIAEAEADTKAEATTPRSATAQLPPTFQEVEKFAKSQPMPIADECIEAFFDEMESLEWTYKGQPCVSQKAWQARFRKWATNWITNRSQPNLRTR